jgi:hypothetical protein
MQFIRVRILYVVLCPVFKMLRQYTYVSRYKTAEKFARNDVVQRTKTRVKKHQYLCLAVQHI